MGIWRVILPILMKPAFTLLDLSPRQLNSDQNSPRGVNRIDRKCAGHIHVGSPAGQRHRRDKTRGKSRSADGSIHQAGAAQEIQRPQNIRRTCGENADPRKRLIGLPAQNEYIMPDRAGTARRKCWHHEAVDSRRADMDHETDRVSGQPGEQQRPPKAPAQRKMQETEKDNAQQHDHCAVNVIADAAAIGAGRMMRHRENGGCGGKRETQACNRITALLDFIDIRHGHRFPFPFVKLDRNGLVTGWNRYLDAAVQFRTKARNYPETTAMTARMDRRTARTRKALLDAFDELVLKDRKMDIRVADIVERANVGRSTFYEHYSSAADLHMQALARPMSILADAIIGKGDREALRWLLEHFWENRQRARATLGFPGREQVARLLAGMLEERLSGLNAAPALPMRLALRHLAEAPLALIAAWVSGEASCSAGALADAICKTSALSASVLLQPEK